MTPDMLPEAPLTGLRMLDLAGAAGVYGTKLLADLGADVIKIEPPGGDALRRRGPFFGADPHPERSLAWFFFNTSKRGVTLNLHTNDGRALVRRLAANADVVFDTWAPSALDALGLGYAELAAGAPGLVQTQGHFIVAVDARVGRDGPLPNPSPNPGGRARRETPATHTVQSAPLAPSIGGKGPGVRGPPSPFARRLSMSDPAAFSSSGDHAGWGDWNAADYLREYYGGDVPPDELATLAFLAVVLEGLEDFPTLLEVGCGPTVHHVLGATPYVSMIHMADYLPANLAEVRRWLQREPGHHDWRAFTREALLAEGVPDPTHGAVNDREHDLRAKVTALLPCDLSQPKPLGPGLDVTYEAVLSCYCADSATADRGVWETYMRNLFSLVAPGGAAIVTALRSCSSYRVGQRRFPAANIDKDDLARAYFANGFYPQTLFIESKDVPEHEDQGYDGILLAVGVKPRRRDRG
ncbi:MAG: CoA transferase [Chloroflexi bacterium]|nr:CoA transferase [Chloroflexota bacterium]